MVSLRCSAAASTPVVAALTWGAARIFRSWLVNTSTPSPVMKPAMTARERKLARNASRKIQKMKNSSAQTRARARAYWRRRGSPGAAKATRAAPTRVAMEASGLVTKWRELASSANTTRGHDRRVETGGRRQAGHLGVTDVQRDHQGGQRDAR